MEIGRRIYYDVQTGDILLDAGEREGDVRVTTIDEDVLEIEVLSALPRESFDVVELPFGSLREQFLSCKSFKINVISKEIEFIYPEVGESV